MDDRDFGALWRYFEDGRGWRGFVVTSKAKCVCVALGDDAPARVLDDLVEVTRKRVLPIRSALYLFSAGNPVVLSLAAGSLERLQRV